jgi:hypothetical protein
MNFWNGANGSPRRSRNIAQRDLMFRLTRESEPDWRHDHSPRDETGVMNWEMLAAIGQLAAVFVGIPSLIYLAVQIRAQTKERRQSAVNVLTAQWGDLTCALHDNAEFSAIFLRGVQSFADLDPVSKLRFSAFFNRFLNHFEAMYFSYCDGILTASSWGKIERTMSDLIAYPGIQQWWKERRHWHTEEFGRVVDAIIAKGDEPKAYSTYNLREMMKQSNK